MNRVTHAILMDYGFRYTKDERLLRALKIFRVMKLWRMVKIFDFIL